MQGTFTAGVAIGLMSAAMTSLEKGPPEPAIDERLLRLAAAYPDQVLMAEPDSIVFRDGTRMAWDDGRKKSDGEMRAEPDLEDMMQERYPLAWGEREAENGRARYDPFFRQVYGATRLEVEQNLVRVRWKPSGRHIRVSGINDIAERIRRIGDELAELPPEKKRFVLDISSYSCRNIMGTDTPSPHRYAIAVDISPRLGCYWGWSSNPCKHEVPREIVEAFERYGFIWGGKWAHWDTMHFEYRPEHLPGSHYLLRPVPESIGRAFPRPERLPASKYISRPRPVPQRQLARR